MSRRFGPVAGNQPFLAARRMMHIVVLLSLLLGYAPVPAQAAPPEPPEPEIEEPAGINQPGMDPDAVAPEFVEDPPAEPEPGVPLTYVEIEAAGSLQVLPAELPPPPVEPPTEPMQEPGGLSSSLYLPLVSSEAADEEPVIVEIGEDLPDGAFNASWDEPWDDVPELAADAFAEEGLLESEPPSNDLPATGHPGTEQDVQWLSLSNELYGYVIEYSSFLQLEERQDNQDAAAASGVPSDLWFGNQIHVIARVPALPDEQVARLWGSAQQVTLAVGTPALRMERELEAIDGVGEPETAIEYLVRGNGADYFLIFEPAPGGDPLVDAEHIFELMAASFHPLSNYTFLGTAAATALAADAFDFFVDPPDGGARSPSYASYNVKNPGLTKISPCYNKPISQLQHAAEDWFRPAGTDIHAVANGTVIYAQNANYPGAVVIVEHTLGSSWTNPWGGDRIYSVYSHLSTSELIPQWSEVTRGQVIGNVLYQENNNHIHFEMRRYGDMSSVLICPANGRSSWPGPGYTDTDVNPDNFGYTHPSNWIDGHRSGGGNPPPPPSCPQSIPNSDQAIVFADTGYGGACDVLGVGEYSNPSHFVKVGNDNISSIRVGNEVRLTLCRDDNYQGCDTFETDDDDLGNNGIGNNNASSAKVERRSAPSDTAKLYSEPNWGGSVVWEGGVGFSNDPNANSYSLELPSGWSAITYREDNHGGLQRCWSASVPNFQDHDDWQSKTQSIEVFDHDVCPKPPAAPSNLNVGSPTESSLTLTWQDNSGDESEFKIYKWDGVDFPYLASVGANTTSYTDSGLNCGSPYFYKISARNDAGESAQVDWVSGNTSACSSPFMPTLLQPEEDASFEEGQTVVFAWNVAANADNYFGEITGGPSLLTFGWLGSTSYSTSALPGGYQYTWHVKSGRDGQESDWSEARTLIVRPATPANVTAASPGCGKVTVTWNDSSGSEEGYRIYRDGKSMGSVGADGTSFTQNAVPEGVYVYRVRAYRGGFISDVSNPAQVIVAACTPPARLAATVTPATQVHNGAARVSTRFTLRESTGTAVQIQSYTSRWYSANGTVALSNVSNPVTLIRSIPGGGSTTWSIGLLLPRGIAQKAADRGESAVRLYMTFRGVDSVGRAVKTAAYVTIKLSACGDATEPNNATANAKTIAYGQTSAGVMCPSGELDLFTFNGAAGDRIRIAARPKSGSAPLNPKLELLASNGRTVLAANDNRAAGQLDARIAFVLPTTGKYYVRVTDAGRLGRPGQSYNLLLNKDMGKPAVVIRPLAAGDWLHAKQQTIRVDASDRETEVDRVQFFIKSPGAAKWQIIGTDTTASDGWWFYWDTSKLPADQGYAIYAYAIDGANNGRGAAIYGLRLERTPPTVKAVTRAAYGDAPFRAFGVRWYGGSDSGSGIASYDVQVRQGATGAWTDWITQTTSLQARYVGSINHIYYFRARARDKTGTVSAYAGGAGDASYNVTVCPVAADGYERDDNAPTADIMATDGNRYPHNFHAEGDQDWAVFNVSAGVTYTLQTYSNGKHADTVLALYDQDGKTMLASNDDFGTPGGPSQIIWQAPANGMYYAQVVHHDRYGYGCTTAYDLTIAGAGTGGPEQPVDPTKRLYLPILRR